MRKLIVPLCAIGLAACDSSPTGSPANQSAAAANESANATASSVPPRKKRPAFCFFKDSETSAWSASRNRQGNVVVKGRAYRSDPRYKAELGPAEVSGTVATISPTISQNSGYASPDNWWDVSATIPDSRQVLTVKVECGRKTLAELGLEPAR